MKISCNRRFSKPVNESKIDITKSDSVTSASRFKVGDKVKDVYDDSHSVGTIEDVLDDNTYGVRWDVSDLEGDNFEYITGDELDSYSEDMADILEYADALGSEVVKLLDAQGFDATAHVEDNFLVIEVESEDPFVQPLADIDPIWSDLNKDASKLSDAVIDSFY